MQFAHGAFHWHVLVKSNHVSIALNVLCTIYLSNWLKNVYMEQVKKSLVYNLTLIFTFLTGSVEISDGALFFHPFILVAVDSCKQAIALSNWNW